MLEQPIAVSTRAPSASLKVRRMRHSSRPATLVVHSRYPAVRFRIVSAPAVPPAGLPVSLLLRAQDVPESDGMLWRRNP